MAGETHDFGTAGGWSSREIGLLAKGIVEVAREDGAVRLGDGREHDGIGERIASVRGRRVGGRAIGHLGDLRWRRFGFRYLCFIVRVAAIYKTYPDIIVGKRTPSGSIRCKV